MLVRPNRPKDDVVVRGARVLDPAEGIDAVVDVRVDGGVVSQIGAGLDANGHRVVDAAGLVLAPAFVDPHVHLRTPGREDEEDLRSGTAAAAVGGFCAILAMPNTDPVVDSAAVLGSLVERARAEAEVPVGFLAAITKAQAGEELTEMVELAEAGAAGFSDDGMPVESPGLLRRALQYSAAVMSASRYLDGDLFDRGALVALRMAAEPIGPVGVRPWRRAPDDPWTDWFRFRHGISFLYGTLFEAKTIGAGMDLSAQWRGFVATAEYIFMHAPSGDNQGAVFEPGVTLFARRLDVVARGEWQRAAGANGWGGGVALTFYAPDPRARLQAGAERHTGPSPAGAASYVLLRLTLAID